MNKRVRIRVTGRVQGVGFRPTVYRYAADAGLHGFVRNTPAGVLAEAEGDPGRVEAFVRRIRREPPPQARIDDVRIEDIPCADDGPFRILPSRGSDDLVVGIPPDLATCADCVRELKDPADRRHRYPFINCTNCGPRFTIVRKLPYDRADTSMASFRQCESCAAEYGNPADRRFDAQPNACPVCGPRLTLLAADGTVVRAADPVAAAVERLREGAMVAVKSLGGYHLCCDAHNDKAVRILRARKGRPAKPFAVMFASLDEVRTCCETTAEEERDLLSCAAPVVVLRRRDSGTFALVAPDTGDIGAFLPYTPLHHLLLGEISPLVMTSGNLSEEPIAGDEAGLARILGRVADVALVHDRAIVRRCDDSVLKRVKGRRLFLRRSRGWVPEPIALPLDGPPVLACGAELKSTLCITRGRQAFLSQHIGDLVEYPSIRFFGEVAEGLMQLLDSRPALVAHDLHPDYESTRFAAAYPAARRVAVQHHHAHIASCMAEHGLTRRVIGVALDGAGYGPDGTVWGGEFLACDLADYERVGHLKPYRMPGGDEAVLHPARMAYSCLLAEFGPDADALAAKHLPGLAEADRRVLARLVETGKHAPVTTSMGRLFDIVSALAGLCDTVSYEGQAAIRLQALAGTTAAEPYPFSIADGVLSFGPAIRAILADLDAGESKAVVAGRFHRTAARAIADFCGEIRGRTGLGDVVLSGGVFQNDLLLDLAVDALNADGFTVYWHHAVPPNDGGICLGQAAVALARAGR